jgi:hypothetical protein
MSSSSLKELVDGRLKEETATLSTVTVFPHDLENLQSNINVDIKHIAHDLLSGITFIKYSQSQNN